MSKETALIARMLAANKRPDVLLWRNETGLFWAGRLVKKNLGQAPLNVWLHPGQIILSNQARVSAGLCKGSSDLIGIGPGGIFLAPEVKTPNTRITPEQPKFIRAVRQRGGLAGFVHSVEELERLIEGEILDG